MREKTYSDQLCDLIMGHATVAVADVNAILDAVQADAFKQAAQACTEYAHSGVNVYRRQVAYAIRRRIEALSPLTPPQKAEKE